jgi:hypothetical protein
VESSCTGRTELKNKEPSKTAVIADSKLAVVADSKLAVVADSKLAVVADSKLVPPKNKK